MSYTARVPGRKNSKCTGAEVTGVGYAQGPVRRGWGEGGGGGPEAAGETGK